jgi:hypothetical protein
MLIMDEDKYYLVGNIGYYVHKKLRTYEEALNECNEINKNKKWYQTKVRPVDIADYTYWIACHKGSLSAQDFYWEVIIVNGLG